MYAAIILLGVSLVFGCQLTVAQETNPVEPVTVTTQPITVEPIPGGSGVDQPGGSLPADDGVVMPVVAGKVTVAVDAAAVSVGQAMSATIANGLDQTVYASDEKTDCSIVTLERFDGAAWQPLINCGLGRLPVLWPIGPGHGRVVKIDPNSSNFGSLSGVSLGPGRYRVTFTYRLDQGFDGAESETASSQPFTL